MPDASSPEQVLVRELRAWRERRGLTAQQVADRIGGKLSRQAISKVENEDRKVTLDELAVLAWALDVPPILLTLPLGREPAVQILPGHTVPTWNAVKWWIGETGGREGGDSAGTAVIGYFRDHDRMEWYPRTQRAAGHDDDEAVRWAVERLRDLRKNMRRAGVLPPDLPAELADIDKEEGGERGGPDQAG